MKIAKMEATLIDHMGTDLSVVNAARVSFHKESNWEIRDGVKAISDKDVKLINYLAKHKHFSPFNHAFITFRIKAPIFVARQLVKHKFMPWNEVSRRYVDEEPEFFWPEKWRAKAENVKQGSSEEEAIYMKEFQWNGEDGFNDREEATEDLVFKQLNGLVLWYKDLIKNNVSAEQARMILPQNMMTEWFWSGTLGAYADMLKLRLDPHTQHESRQVAEMVRDELIKYFPVSLNALLENK